MKKKQAPTIYQYIYQGPQHQSPQLAVSMGGIPDHIDPTHITYAKKISIKHQRVIEMLLDDSVDPEKKTNYLQYQILRAIQRTQNERQNNFYYKDVKDLIYHMGLENTVYDMIIKPGIKLMEKYTDPLPPDEHIRAKIAKRRAKRNSKK